MIDGSEKMQVDVTYVFDEILARHMERLLGSRYGIGGLQLRIGTIACLTLIADQLDREQDSDQPSNGGLDTPIRAEGTIASDTSPSVVGGAGKGEHQDSGPGEENTTEALENRLAELGLRDKDKVQSLIQEMVEKGYLLADDHGKLTGGKPAVSMARLLERVFPKLPGKTLVAYFIQTIDEVLTGRKTTEIAVAHFDQTLKMQGLPLKHLKTEKTSHVQSSIKKERENLEAPGDIQQVLKRTQEPLTTKEEERAGFRIIGSSDDGFRYTAKDVQTVPPITPSSLAVPDEQVQEEQPVSVEPPSPRVLEDKPVSLDTPVEQVPESGHVSLEIPSEQPPEILPVSEEVSEGTSDEIPARTPSEEQEGPQAKLQPSASSDMQAPGDVPPAEAEKEQAPPEEEDGPGEVEKKPTGGGEEFSDGGGESVAAEQDSEQPEETGDDLIEKQISGFQNELASLCPLCKEGKVREEKTGTGRVYFKCSNKGCNLVSWGRPHHISCPICNNPFLIEMSAGQEKVNLQCPRATCKYQCTISETEPVPGLSAGKSGKPRRRVVRRRVVKKRK